MSGRPKGLLAQPTDRARLVKLSRSSPHDRPLQLGLGLPRQGQGDTLRRRTQSVPVDQPSGMPIFRLNVSIGAQRTSALQRPFD